MKKWTSFQFDDILDQPAKKSARKTKEKPKSKIVIKDSSARAKLLSRDCLQHENFNFFKEIEPQTVDDLAVHPKKLAELEAWLDRRVLAPQQTASLLLVTGPSGCGKTAAIRVLCKQKSIGIAEWINPIQLPNYQFDREIYSDGNYVNQVTRFTEFVVESRYGNLFSGARSNVCLVQDFPNTFLRTPEEFPAVLEDISAAGNVCVIFVANDDGSAATNIERNLFPEATQAKFGVDVIAFNSCAATLMKKAMARAQCLVRANAGMFDSPSESVVEAICAASTGDIRCCVNQFYLAALKGSKALQVEFKTETKTKAGTKRKRATKTATLMTKLKDETLGLFHSIGRVLHPKLDPVTRKIHHDLDALIDEFSTQPNVFLGFLHENYARHFGDVEDAMHACTGLSLAQRLLDQWSERRESYVVSLYIAVMGFMLHNKHHVSMWNPIRGPVKIKREVATVSRTTSRPVDPVDVCYYNLLVKKTKFNRFEDEV